MKNVRFIGLDVHAETIAVAVAERGDEVRSLGTIPTRPESVGHVIRKLGKPEQLRVCYEAAPPGYVLYWQLSELGVRCEMVARRWGLLCGLGNATRARTSRPSPAQHRLHARYAKLLAKGKPKQQVITAVGRELFGFIWAIGVATEHSQPESPGRALKRAALLCDMPSWPDPRD
jgi:hypothetical protein